MEIIEQNSNMHILQQSRYYPITLSKRFLHPSNRVAPPVTRTPSQSIIEQSLIRVSEGHQ